MGNSIRVIISFLALGLMLVLFQNCDQGMEAFEGASVNDSSNNQEAVGEDDTLPQPKLACGNTPHGGTETKRMYLATTAVNCQGIDRTRTCDDGQFTTWTGSDNYQQDSCTPTNPTYQSCGSTPHGDHQVQTYYQNNSVPYGQSCGQGVIQRRMCNDGTFGPWDGTLTHTICQIETPANCGPIQHGARQVANFFQSTTVPFGQTCNPITQSRLCNNGNFEQWSGTLTIRNCGAQTPQSCGSTAHGSQESRIRYRMVNGQCETGNQMRLCTDGSFGAWSMDYTLPSCSNSGTNTVSLDSDVFFIGHSLISTTLPSALGSVVSDQGGSASMDYQIINGSPLVWNWDHSHEAQGQDARVALPQGQHEVLVITEAVPLKNHTTYSNSNLYASQFYNIAIAGNPSIQAYMYETWHCINSGTPTGCSYDNEDDLPWRQRLSNDISEWEGIVNHVNGQKATGAKDMLLVPAGQAMARLYDEIQQNQVNGVSNINQFFADNIHLNDLGFYYISMVHYATIYKRSPIGLSRSLRIGSTNFQVPTQTLADQLQQMAWTTVCNYPRSGVTCN